MKASVAGMLMVLGGALCFSMSGFTQAQVLGLGATPFGVAAVRMIISGASLFLWLAATHSLPSVKGWPVPNVILCCLSIAGYQLFFFTGTYYIGVAVAAVVAMATTPIVTAIISAMFFREPPSRAWYPSTVFALAGIVLMNTSVGTDVDFAKLLFPVAAGSCYAVYLNAARKILAEHDPVATVMVLHVMSAVILLPAVFIEPMSWLCTLRGGAAALHLGVVTMALGYVLLFKGLIVTPASVAATLGLAEPASAAMLGFCCLGEPVTACAVAGVTAILAGSLMLIFLPRFRMFR